MNPHVKSSAIRRVAFVYLIPASGSFYVTDELSFNIQRRPKLGLQYLCAVLEQKGIHTALFDQTVSFFDFTWLLNTLNNFDMVAFYCSDPQEQKVKEYCRKIKQQSTITIIVGGPSTLGNTSFLDCGCDIVVHGEGELTMQQIVDYYNGNCAVQDVKGISYKNDGQLVTAQPQELISDIDQFPFPDRSKVSVNAYYDYFLFGMKKTYITMIASRGCVFRCSFCASCSLWGFRYRQRSVGNVIAEIDEVVARYGVRYIAFQDDMFGLTDEWVEEFCRALIAKPYRIRWMAIFHPLSFHKKRKEMLTLMKQSGRDTLSIGLQSAHPQILRTICRNPDDPEHLKEFQNRTAAWPGDACAVYFRAAGRYAGDYSDNHRLCIKLRFDIRKF